MPGLLFFYSKPEKIPLYLKYLYFMHNIYRNILVTVVEIIVIEYRNIH